MPQGYYTIEQWVPQKTKARPKWVAILNLPFGESLTAAERALENLGKPGIYRLVHTQRVIWAEKVEGKLRLRKSHAGSPESLERMRQMFERTGGRYPIEEVREARRRAKNKAAPARTRRRGN
jgi:hypothetical protein